MLKTIPKILITIFLLIFIFQLASLIFLMAVPEASHAGVDKLDLQVDIGKTTEVEFKGSTSAIAEYIKAIYKYALGIVGILATVVLMFGGVLWIAAGGNAERIANAKSWIGAALTGLVLALTSYMILYIVNPGLVNFRVTPVTTVEGDSGNKVTNCCQSVGYCTSNSLITKKECEGTKYNGTFHTGETCDLDTGKCGMLGCCVYKPYGASRVTTHCKNNTTETWCTTEKAGKNPTWKSNITCAKNDDNECTAIY